jgi:hypothetical protein
LPRCEGFGQEHCNISNDVGNKKARLSFRQNGHGCRFSWNLLHAPQADQIGVDCDHIFASNEITVKLAT